MWTCINHCVYMRVRVRSLAFTYVRRARLWWIDANAHVCNNVLDCTDTHRRVGTPLCCMKAWLLAVIGLRLRHSRCLLSFYSLYLSLSPSLFFSLSRPPSLLFSLLQAITHTCTKIGADIYAPRCQAHRVFDASADNASIFSDHERSKVVALSVNCRSCAFKCLRAWRL